MAWVFAVGPILRKVCRIAGPALAMQEYCVRKVLRGLPKNSRTVARGDQADRFTSLVTVAIAIASGFDFSAFCKAEALGPLSPRVPISNRYNGKQITPLHAVWRSRLQTLSGCLSLGKLLLEPNPTLHVVAHCLRNRNIPHERSFYGC
jgi:hypothetical protein